MLITSRRSIAKKLLEKYGIPYKYILPLIHVYLTDPTTETVTTPKKKKKQGKVTVPPCLNGQWDVLTRPLPYYDTQPLTGVSVNPYYYLIHRRLKKQTNIELTIKSFWLIGVLTCPVTCPVAYFYFIFFVYSFQELFCVVRSLPGGYVRVCSWFVRKNKRLAVFLPFQRACDTPGI